MDKFIDSTIDHFNIDVMAALLLPLEVQITFLLLFLNREEKRKDKLTLSPLAEVKVK